MRQIAHNAGFEAAVIIGRVRESKDENFGFNADLTGRIWRPVKSGVIDPAKVGDGSRYRMQRRLPR